MPILAPETDLYPSDLLENESRLADTERQWWLLYTRSRQEKELMRRLHALQIPFYGPTIPRRSRTPKGRQQTSFIPLFLNYVFMWGDLPQRYAALTTNCISRDIPVSDGIELVGDLRQLQRLIRTGVAIVPETTLEAGQRVRVRSGPLTGQEGIVLQRRGETRLLVAVRFLQQGASVQLDECDLERLD